MAVVMGRGIEPTQNRMGAPARGIDLNAEVAINIVGKREDAEPQQDAFMKRQDEHDGQNPSDFEKGFYRMKRL